MNYTKPEVAVLGQAVRVIEADSPPQDPCGNRWRAAEAVCGQSCL